VSGQRLMRWLARRGHRQQVVLRGMLVLLACVLLLAMAVEAFGATPASLHNATEPVQVITEATLQTASGERQVQLPHVLEPGDFDPQGSRVYYRLKVKVQDPNVLRAIYIQKMARSGRIMLNDRDSGSCGRLLLQFTRCHHHPQFFRTPYTDWRVGENQIEVEIYATNRQSNGLSEVVVGPRDVLYWKWFMPQLLLQVQTLEVLTWLTMALGVLSLVVFAVLRKERMYLWFSLACLIGAVSKITIQTVTPALSLDLFDWLVFASRFLFSCTFGLTYLAYFNRERSWHVWSLAAYSILGLWAIWASSSSPKIVSLLYLPLLGLGFVLAVASIVWARRSGLPSDKVMALSFVLMPLAGLFDMARLRGASAFTGIYFLPYTTSITLALMGMGMIGRLALALRTTRDLSSILQARVDAREAELLSSHRQIVQMEQLRARTDERERILRDMHDGFLSTLALTRTALGCGQTTAQQARQMVTECMDDLRLMLETSSKDEGTLGDVMADFFHRFENRMTGAGIEASLEMQLEGMPALDSPTLLQMMRIVQEATNNAIRHSGAQKLSIRALWDQTSHGLTLEIQDDGKGLTEEIRVDSTGPQRTRRGLHNMRTRAQAIDAMLEMLSSQAGCCIRLKLQVPTSADAAALQQTATANGSAASQSDLSLK
jgi:signal transduction histidine kinase